MTAEPTGGIAPRRAAPDTVVAAGEELIARTYSAVPDAVAEARRFVTAWLRTPPPTDDALIDEVALGISEACTNVVMHAYPHGDSDGNFRVHAWRSSAWVTVTVSDDGGGMVPRPDSPGLGLGMPLMASVTVSLDVRAPAAGSGTVVTMHFGGDARAA
jgi:serine/threonine-protein kinase RsbW